MSEENLKRIADSIQIVLEHFGVENRLASIQDATVSDKMTDEDSVYSDDNIKIFSVGEKMYVVDYVIWNENRSARPKKDSPDLEEGSLCGKVPCVQRVFIWDIDAGQKRLYRSDEAWERLLFSLEKKALDEEYAKDPLDCLSLAEGFVETE
ncbi:hypothetical protein IKW75_03185 [Candidatus Saccharibacteria bacterium]|nr:hypothetical protein [Candidatus Saccharibacteria bacterium]